MEAHLASILAPSPELEDSQAVHLAVLEAALVLVAVVPGADAQAISLPAHSLLRTSAARARARACELRWAARWNKRLCGMHMTHWTGCVKHVCQGPDSLMMWHQPVSIMPCLTAGRPVGC